MASQFARIATPGLLLALALGCATTPDASPERCARARLARDWAAARPESFVGCFVDVGGGIAGTVVLSDDEDDGAYDDEARRFRLAVVEAVGQGDERARWELLSTNTVRLSFVSARPAGIDAVEACVVADVGDGAVDRLDGVVYAVVDHAPFVGPSTPVSLRRVQCPS
jgi:hypothetical protein